VGLLYAKPPHSVAEDHILIYNVLLPKFRNRVHDLTKPLDAWLYILDTANQKQLSLEEVIEMEPILRETIDIDAGLKQFAEEYSKVAADPAVQKEYSMYYSEIMRVTGMLQAAQKKGEKEGEARGEARGKAEERQNTAKKMLVKGLPLETISDITDISIDDLKELQAEITIA
jgi:predicted transposase/invertase (TIGR01784 family)